MVFNVCSLQLIFFQMEFWEDLMLKWGVNGWFERGRAVVVAGRFWNDVCLEISSYRMCIYIYMVYAIEKNMTSISILMLPTSLFDPIHVKNHSDLWQNFITFLCIIQWIHRYWQKTSVGSVEFSITVELPESMSTVRFSYIFLIMSNLANAKITIPFTPSGTIRSMCQLLSSKLCLLSHHLVKA